MKKILVTLMLACALSASAQMVYDNPEIVFNNDEEQQIFTTDKLHIVLSLIKGAPLMDFQDNPLLMVYVKNNSDQSILVDPTEITATATKGKKSKKLEVYTRKKLESKFNNKMFWFGPNNYKDVTTTTNIEYKDNSGNKQSAKEQTTTKVYTGDADKAQEVANDFFNNMYLKKNTVFPDNELSGVILMDKAKMENIVVTFDIDGAQFIAKFNIKDW